MRRIVFVLLSMLFLPVLSAAEQRYTIPVDNSPQIGFADAPVTIIEFLDFQ